MSNPDEEATLKTGFELASSDPVYAPGMRFSHFTNIYNVREEAQSAFQKDFGDCTVSDVGQRVIWVKTEERGVAEKIKGDFRASQIEESGGMFWVLIKR